MSSDGQVFGEPPWRYVLGDGRLHMIRREVAGVAEALCPLRVTVAALTEPGGEDRRYVARALRTLADALDAAGQLPAADPDASRVSCP